MAKVGVFFVRKKDGRFRLIIDGRESSCHFELPDKIQLASGSTFGGLSVDADDPIWIGEVDLADAFYHLGVPAWLQQYFGLPSITAGAFVFSTTLCSAPSTTAARSRSEL